MERSFYQKLLRYDELIKFSFGLRQIVTPVHVFVLPFFNFSINVAIWTGVLVSASIDKNTHLFFYI